METSIGKISTKTNNTLVIFAVILTTVSAIAVTVSSIVQIKHYKMMMKQNKNCNNGI